MWWFESREPKKIGRITSGENWIFEYKDQIVNCICEKVYQSKRKEWIAKITDWTEHTPDPTGIVPGLSSLVKERIERDAIRICKCRIKPKDGEYIANMDVINLSNFKKYELDCLESIKEHEQHRLKLVMKGVESARKLELKLREGKVPKELELIKACTDISEGASAAEDLGYILTAEYLRSKFKELCPEGIKDKVKEVEKIKRLLHLT